MDLSRQECRNLLLHRGFFMKTKEDDEIPISFRDGPYGDVDKVDL